MCSINSCPNYPRFANAAKVTKPLKIIEQKCNTAPPAALGLQGAAKFARRRAGPFSERAMKCTAFGESQFQRNVHDAAARMTQIADREITPQLVLDRLIRLPFLVQSAAHRCGRHVKFIGQLLEVRHLAGQALAET